MRQILFRISLERPWAGWTDVPGEVSHLGACWVLLAVAAVYTLIHWTIGKRELLRDPGTWLTWGIALLLLSLLGGRGWLPASVPIFGYGMMVLTGFVTGIWFAWSRAKAVGTDPELILDFSTWLLLFGIAGGRLAYLIQYWRQAFHGVQSFWGALFAVVNLSEGGLVLIGGMAGGLLGFVLFCLKRKQDPFDLADLIIPAVFIGIGFGRIGCLLNGCCFGDRCDLPWGITFPQGSVTFEILAERGFVDPAAAHTMPLHPTQIYSALDGFILALVTGTFYWYRRSRGAVFGLGCLLYALTRFQIEFLRSDEMGQLGTGLTISQLYCLGILTLGVALLATARWRRIPQNESSGHNSHTVRGNCSTPVVPG